MRNWAFVGVVVSLLGCSLDVDTSGKIEPDSAVGIVREGLSSTYGWAYLWSQDFTGSFDASASYSRSSAGAVANHVTWLSTGLYRVDLPGIGTEYGGNAQVTAYGGTSERCQVGGWGPNETGQSVWVYCFTAAGAPVDSRFTLAFVRRPTNVGSGGYLWLDNSSTTQGTNLDPPNYWPTTWYQYNSTGQDNGIVRWGTGRYAATITGATSSVAPAVQATAYGNAPAFCAAGDSVFLTTRWKEYVRCYNSAGSFTNNLFTLSVTWDTPNGGSSYFYGWIGFRGGASSMTVESRFARGYTIANGGHFITTPVTATRSGVGVYSVSLPEVDWVGSNAIVTSYQSRACKIAYWFSNGSSTDLNVRCYDFAGTPQDSDFHFVYTTAP